MIRGTAAAPLSQLLSAIEPALRLAAGLGAWQVVSPAAGAVTGRLEIAAALAHVQHARYAQPTVLLVDAVGGEEDMPEVRPSRHTATCTAATPTTPLSLCRSPQSCLKC